MWEINPFVKFASKRTPEDKLICIEKITHTIIPSFSKTTWELIITSVGVILNLLFITQLIFQPIFRNM